MRLSGYQSVTNPAKDVPEMTSIAFFFGTIRPQASFTASIAASTIGCTFSGSYIRGSVSGKISAFLTRQKTGKWQANFGLQSALR